MIKNFMYFTILTFAVILVWISLTIYRNFNPAVPITGVAVEPIEGSFDFNTVNRLRTRLVVPVDFAQNFIATPSPELEEEVAPPITPSSAFNLTVTIPAATPSGIIATSSAQ